jgi:phosphatidylethanolamine/phosphatidyl-N-methylethanolamine N-methyltransferase
MSWTFFRQFILNWKTTGAIAPSSSELANLMVESAGVSQADTILELGTGTGAFTQRIAEVMRKDAHYLGIDLNEGFVKVLSRRFPHMKFEAVAAQDCNFADFLGDGRRFDCIVSGLPWAAFPHSLQESILDQVLPWLRPGGRFVTFAYAGLHLMPSGQRFKALLKDRCVDLRRTKTILNNLPPAFVYSASVNG